MSTADPKPLLTNFTNTSNLYGFRLNKLEVYNWGTFDGEVFIANPAGRTTLLVGENGSGKSTLVDALLTLLVRPQTRNYNVAAGAQKNERDERSYIRGAFDRTTDAKGRPQIQYLRSVNDQYSALLANFKNFQTGESFTLVQILYLNRDQSVEKIYAFRDGEGSILADFGGFSAGHSIPKQIRDRGYRTTSSYSQYFTWLQRKVSLRDKAMHVFNQTVAVKDVQRLDAFIRQHMLEPKPWQPRVNQLLCHFEELSSTHRSLAKARQQFDLLTPIIELAAKYREITDQLEIARRQIDAATLFFAHESIELLTEECKRLRLRGEHLQSEVDRLEKKQGRLQTELARLEIELETHSGDRLRLLPQLVDHAEHALEKRRLAFARLKTQLKIAALSIPVTSPDQFLKLRSLLDNRREELAIEKDLAKKQLRTLHYEIGSLSKSISEQRSEIDSLSKRGSNLPEPLLKLRDSMCSALGLQAAQLPFAGELISVAEEHSDWEEAIEKVLFGLARTLLVCEPYYIQVSKYLENTRLLDRSGRGLQLSYLRVPNSTQQQFDQLPVAPANTMLTKLKFRAEHPLSAWIQSELIDTFSCRTCDTLEEFQRNVGPAMTKNRHWKSTNQRHKKDDRQTLVERQSFVLGWDNRNKIESLTNSVTKAERALNTLQSQAEIMADKFDAIVAALEAVEQASQITDFESIDFASYELEVTQLKTEQEQLENSDNPLVELRTQQDRLVAETSGCRVDRDALIRDLTLVRQKLSDGQLWLAESELSVQQARGGDDWQRAAPEFESLRKQLDGPIDIENLKTLPSKFLDTKMETCGRLESKLSPVTRELVIAMTRFLKRFPDEQADLDAHVLSLPSFEGLYLRLAQDDLPSLEKRFEQRFNEKVLHELGMLHAGLQNDRQEIVEKIGQLNSALRLLNWKPDSFMQLETTDATDREIQDFRKELAKCLSEGLAADSVDNETTFAKINRLIEKLRDENFDRWRQKVMDVRNWFNFAAREFVHGSGAARSFYEGGSGQSGGEKGKLAFLVLVAALAYQFNIDPRDDHSNQFHFVMVDEMFSRSDDKHAEYALDLFDRFGLQLLIVAPLDAKARVTEPYVGTYLHVVKDKQTNRSRLLEISADTILPEGE